jgi:hypothetical protein
VIQRNDLTAFLAQKAVVKWQWEAAGLKEVTRISLEHNYVLEISAIPFGKAM